MLDILDYLKGQQLEMESALQKLVEAESPSKNKLLADQCGTLLKELFEEIVGGTAETIVKEEVGNQYRFTYGSGAEQILIIGHYDTVWDQGALPLRKEEGVLYGPGVFDMKGGLVIVLWALRALKHIGEEGKRKVVFLVTSDEEIGSAQSRGLIEEEAKKSALVLVPESSISTTGAVKTSRKGIGIFKISVRGKPVHAGINPWAGVSAIDELMMQLAELKKLDNQEENISINIGTVSGGGRTNVVAAFAEADIDLRFRNTAQGERLKSAILNRTPFIEGAEVEVTGDINRYPMEQTDAVMGLYRQLKEIAAGHGYELEHGNSGGASDGNLTAAIGITTIDGLGPVGDGAHAENEHVILENLPYRSALLAELIKRHMN
ncbi:glutamate carboxypeptidase [Planomicrobium sp. HSC-17F08]|nr:glutamate carboxypeptidase [Planomicrobium sp. HSC-17F08]